MIMLGSRIALGAFLLSVTQPASAQSASRPVPRGPLSSLVSPADYPQQALRDEAEGTVRFRLEVGTDGRVAGCTILRSSGASILDASTCRLMRSRARFTPARDAAGRTVAGQVEDELIWSIGSTTISIVPTATPRTRLYTLTNIYAACVEGDASRRAISTMDIEAIPEAALATCADIEPVFLAEIARANQPNMVAADALRLFKKQLRPQLVEKVRTIRAKLATPSRY